jgi:hypothetical protein
MRAGRRVDQLSNDVLGDAVNKILLLRVAAQILERQYRQ